MSEGPKREWVVVEETAGQYQADMLRSLLEAQGITVIISQEAIGSVIPFTVGPDARTQLLVKPEDAEHAREVLKDYRNGVFMDQEWAEPDEDGQEAG